MKWVALILFGGVGLLTLVSGVWWGARRYQITSGGETALGVVVDQFESERSGKLPTPGRTRMEDQITFLHPIVEFETEQGESFRVQGSTGGRSPVLETGSEVSVVYDPADPSQAVILEFKQAWLGPLVLALAGVVFLAMGVGGFFALADADRRAPPIDELVDQARREMQRQLEERGDPDRR